VVLNANLKIVYVRINPFLFKRFKSLKKNPGAYSGYFYGKLKKNITEFKPDLLIANHVMYEGFIANAVFHKMRIPYVCFEHSPDDFIPLNEKHSTAYKKVVEESRYFINVSDYSFKKINDVYDFKKSNNVTLYNYSQDAMKYKDDTVLARFGINKNNKHIIEVANFENRKNHLSVLKAFEIFKDEFPDWDVIFIGTHDQTLEQLNSFIAFNGLLGRVQIIKDVRHIDVLNLLNFMDIFVLPSDNEMFSVSVLEAISAGLPVISTIHNGLTDGIFKDCPVTNINPKNLTDLEKYLKLLIKDENFRRETGKKSRLMYEKYFTGEIYEAKINDIIKKSLNKEAL
jgi:glycosyltransferase involved in cell wall biosynthesis